jgi:hypothetical protein
MRASSGLGLIAIISLFACTATGVANEPAGPGGGAAGENGSSTDPTTPEGSEDPTDPEKAPSPIVANIAISGVAVFQAVKVDVVKGGTFVASSKRNAPVVAKRPGLIRVYVEPGDGWKAREVTAEVRLVAKDEKFPILRETKTISGPSKDEDPKSTFNLEVPAESLPPGVSFQVALTAADGETVKDGDESEGRFPLDGSLEDLGVEISGKLRVVIVPLQYNTDGSGRTPDLGTAQLERYKKTLMQRYPASDVEVTTHQPYPWTTTIAGNGQGFSSVLRAMHQLRQRDKVDDDVYYYGLFSPAVSMSSFCRGGCVTGLSTVADEDTPVMRASVGLGFVGQDSANTMAHELGHAHGREHAPCGGASGVDPEFPYPQAQLGVWGYDIFGKTLISPTKGRDMMGYCPNEWVSDYTYNALFERMAAISTVKRTLSFQGSTSATRTSRYRIATVGASGDLAWDGDAIDIDHEIKGGTVVPAHFLSGAGVELATRSARFFRFDHLPGGFLLVPQDGAGGTWRTVRVDGYAQQLARP